MTEKCLICGEEVPIGFQHECQIEHVHEWHITPYGIKCFDPDCDEQMPSGEGDRRLNATDRLSAEDVKAMVFVSEHNESLSFNDICKLRVYADIREGK
jgi:hypothetical protein